MPAVSLKFSRRPLQPFDDPTVEEYAQARAAGRSVAHAKQHTGLSTSHAKQCEDEPDFIARLRELRGSQQTASVVSLGWVVNELMKNVDEARAIGQIKASNDALLAISDLVTKNKQLIGQLATNTGTDKIKGTAEKRADSKARFAALSAQASSFIQGPVAPSEVEADE